MSSAGRLQVPSVGEEVESGRAEVEARLLAEAEAVVSRLEAALAAAPEDDDLRMKLERIVEQARRLRSRVQAAIAKAHAKDQENGPG
jgi:predicted ATP-grasp superfamily ATP-dependent carboligase